MIKRNKLTDFLNEYLAIHDFPDSSWNGLQVAGKDEVSNVVLGVTAGVDLFTQAEEKNADFIITHHGHFWEYDNPSLVGWKKDRLGILLANNISLYAAHLPLDRHPEVGNNARLLKCLEAEITGGFCQHDGVAISWWGTIPRGKHVAEIEEILIKELGSQCITLPFGPRIVQSVAVCTGGGGYRAFSEALTLGVDLFITGDTAEIYHVAKDAGVNVIFAGHHATETLGVKALAEVIQEKFNIPARFIDIPTGL